MDLIKIDDLRALISEKGPCVSIYMPARKTGQEVRENSTRFKNLVREAQRRMQGARQKDEDGPEISRKMESLLSDSGFWRRQSAGLAAFFSPGTDRWFRLPESFREMVSVGGRFLVKPLIPHLAGWGRFYVLALSLGGTRLIRCFRYTAVDVTPEDTPLTFAEAMRFEDPEKHIQSHTGVPGPGTSRGGTNIFHGQGSGADEKRHKKDILRFFQTVDSVIGRVLGDENVPLVTAGVDYLRAIYTEANSYRHILPKGIRGNPDRMSDDLLHDEAWKIVEPVLLEERDRAASDFERLRGTPRAAEDIEAILPAAVYGQVASLFVARGRELWGRFEGETGNVETYEKQDEGTTDLLDLAAANVILAGGDVYVEDERDLPGGSPVAAVLRYPAAPAGEGN